MSTVKVDGYVLDVLMADLVGHDRQRRVGPGTGLAVCVEGACLAAAA